MKTMVVRGKVKNGVVVLESGPKLPDGTLVLVSFEIPPDAIGTKAKRVRFPLVRSKRPGPLSLTAERVAELLEEEDVSS